VQRDAAAHAVPGHHVGHAPEADPVAIVAMGVVEHVRHRSRPRDLARVVGRLELVMLDVGCQPYGDARPARPDDARAPAIRRVIVMPRFGQHPVPPAMSLPESPAYPNAIFTPGRAWRARAAH